MSAQPVLNTVRDGLLPCACCRSLQLREALTVGKISFVEGFFSNTASVKIMRQNCEDEMVSSHRSSRPCEIGLTATLVCSPQRNFCILVEGMPPNRGYQTSPNLTPRCYASQRQRPLSGASRRRYAYHLTHYT